MTRFCPSSLYAVKSLQISDTCSIEKHRGMHTKTCKLKLRLCTPYCIFSCSRTEVSGQVPAARNSKHLMHVGAGVPLRKVLNRSKEVKLQEVVNRGQHIIFWALLNRNDKIKHNLRLK